VNPSPVGAWRQSLEPKESEPVKDLDEYMKLDYPYETTTDEEGGTVVSDPTVPAAHHSPTPALKVRWPC
jgi:hypothetical protein